MDKALHIEPTALSKQLALGLLPLSPGIPPIILYTRSCGGTKCDGVNNRSVAPFSIDSPHTGAMSYNDNVKKIPAACITIEVSSSIYKYFVFT